MSHVFSVSITAFKCFRDASRLNGFAMRDRWENWIGACGFCSEPDGKIMLFDRIHLHPALRLRKIETKFS